MEMTVIIGGSGSGKSSFAEQYFIEHVKTNHRYYIATMQIYGEEGKQKVERHQMMRQGKGFQTIEQPRNLGDASKSMEDKCGALLECMSNLVANEMFTEQGVVSEEETVKYVLQGIEEIAQKTSEIVIVTNNVFEDGCLYDESTMAYNRALGEINIQLAKKADRVIEVIAGIANVWKECVQQHENL